MLAITLSADRRLIGKHLISLGSFHDTDFDIPVLINRIIQDKAHGVVVGHNHPTGLGIFSYDDVISTMKILFVCNMINITLYDHLLFPYNKSYSSMKRKWPKLFKLNYGHVFYKAFDKHIPRLVKEEMKDHESQVH